ncbi:uncharacterized protein K02A2.6-like isoform X1 [Takifugu flavidus]|uniref:uncharacterized protein K02A2.6-like isoform X1 n=1 Tax=Takifugu flavidus TaxID=433684 RepID=UPI002544B872|nr:uncharacterized protein K02A2.6-like isoform X1 [Takifugu flavidus]
MNLMFSGPFKEKSEEEKCSYLLLWIVDKGRGLYNTWTLTKEERKVLKTYYDHFQAYVEPKVNVIFARYMFHQKVQGATEPFEQFVTELRLLVKDCSYNNSEEMVRDRVLFGIYSPKVREKLLSVESDLTLDKAIDIARSHGMAQAQLRSFANSGSVSSHEQGVHMSRHTSKGAAWKTRADWTKRKQVQYPRNPQEGDRDHSKLCGYCGNRAHREKDTCPAKGKQCKICNKWNHFAKVCHSKTRKVHSVSEKEQNQDPDNEDLFIDVVTQENNTNKTEQAYGNVQVGPNKTVVHFKLDTGTDTNVINPDILRSLGLQDTLEPSLRPLYGYGGEQLSVKGKCNIKCQYKDTKLTLKVHVVDTRAPPVLGLKACLDFGLIKLILSVSDTPDVSILDKFADVFTGIGLFPGECTIHLDPKAIPVVHPPRRVPIALRKRLKMELQNMEKQQVIKVTEPTEWVNSMVAAEKPRTGKLRVCLDPKDLNKAIKQPHYPLPTLDDVTAKLAGACYFSVMDARSGYWAIKLTEESSKLTTFNTVFGRYRFLRLPFGIISAQDEFQRRVDETYEGLQGVTAIVDDILIFAKTKEEHDKNLHAMLQRSRERGVKLNPEKSTICATEVS